MKTLGRERGRDFYKIRGLELVGDEEGSLTFLHILWEVRLTIFILYYFKDIQTAWEERDSLSFWYKEYYILIAHYKRSRFPQLRVPLL